MKENYKGKNAITLVALIVTIVVLLILAGISISTLTNTGIFQKAKEAKSTSENAEKEQNKILEEYEKVLDQYGDNTLISWFNSGKIKVGDYVSYTPDQASTAQILQELNKYSGSNENTSSTLKQEMNLNWRVLDIKDGQVRLISEKPTESKITLYGAKGYNNAVYLLDKICKTLYTNSNLTNKVQNVKIEDLQNHLTYDYTEQTNPNVDTGKYGGTKEYTENKSYPSILAKETTAWIDGKKGTELGLSEQQEPIDDTAIQAKNSIKVTLTHWMRALNEDSFTEPIYYEIFHKDGNKYAKYFMSSRCIYTYEKRGDFNIRYIQASGVHISCLYASNMYTGTEKAAFRPVITLNKNVQIDTTKAANGSTAEQAYIIK